MKTLNVGVMGATGAAGIEFLNALNQHPFFEVRELYASERSAGKTLEEALGSGISELPQELRNMVIRPIAEVDTSLDLICSALPTDQKVEDGRSIARYWEEFYAQHLPIISTTSAFRYEHDVSPLILEVNAEHLALLEQQRRSRGWNGWIAPGPNCTTVGLVMSLAPIYKEFGIKSVFMTSSQAVSGGGKALIEEWDNQREQGLPLPLDVKDLDTTKRIVEGNVIGDIDGEEGKVRRETVKIMGSYNGGVIVPAKFVVDCLCSRVPVYDGHFEQVVVETKNSCTPEGVMQAYKKFNMDCKERFGNLPSSPEETIVVLDRSPQPRLYVNINGGMSAVVGRIESTPFFGNDKGIKYQVLSHNRVKGAAKGMVQVAEHLYSIGFLQPKPT